MVKPEPEDTFRQNLTLIIVLWTVIAIVAAALDRC